MKRFFHPIRILFLLALLPLAAAQSPSDTTTQVFERVVATEVPCSASPELGQAARSFDFAFCGYIGDTLTDLNTSWTTEEFRADGYAYTVPWDVDRSPGAEIWLSGFTNGRYVAVAMLMVSHDLSGTIIMLTFSYD